jgi:signal transduction histidine kinase
MFRDFLATHRFEIIRRTRAKVASRSSPPHTQREIGTGVPQFLNQLVDILSLADGSPTQVIHQAASAHGAELLRSGFTIAQVVHDYGDVCQAVTELATETNAPITVEEFHTLNRCLDDAIAGAVTEYARLREVWLTNEETERSGVFAHELRNKLSAARHAFTALQSGRVGIGGSTAAIIDRSLRGMGDLITTSLAEVRIEAGKQHAERVNVAELIDEVGVSAALDALLIDVEFSVQPVDPGLEVLADPAVLASAITNLIQNAFKFGQPSGRPARVELRIAATPDRVRFEVEDECGGLTTENHEELFLPYTQRGVNRKGLGLGLYSSRKGMNANGGHIGVRDLPGKGCVFSIDVPRAEKLG